MARRRLGIIGLAATAMLGVAGCGGSDTTAVEAETALVSVVPEAGTSDVATDATIEVTFDGPMHDHAADYADLHVGDVSGPRVEGEWSMESGGKVLRFTPHEPLTPGTQHTVHLGGGMMDAAGHAVDMETHGTSMGGMWADSGMMGDGMGAHMGAGWQHANGTHGMVFTFTTAGTAPTSLVSVEPQGGATDVDPGAPIVVTFDHAVDPSMTEYVALHEGDVRGPEVPGAWELSEDSTRLVFTRDEPLKAATEYTLHLGGGMTDAEGHHLDVRTEGTHMGGEWATDSMMSGGMHGGMDGGGHDHMGEGWDHPENGSHGLVFTFTTAG
jgi:hypothetical protein